MSNERILTRTVESTVIPAGDKINLPEGTKVTITHRLGGNFTVVCDYGMFRIQGKDADALSENIPSEGLHKLDHGNHQGPPETKLIWEQLKTVFDPEIPVNIVDLGLVYNLDVYEIETNKWGVKMDMTLTAPGCGMGPSIAADAKARIESVPGVTRAEVELVWDPPWNQEMISEEGKMTLGLV